MEYIKLGELSEFIMGQAPNSQYCNKKGEGTPFVKAGQFGVKYPIIDEWTTKSLKKALKKDVLICVVGATAGKINLGCDCSIGRSVSAIRCNEKKLDHVYLYYYLKTWITKIRQQSQGSAVGVITKEMLNDIIIPVVTLSEQNRIVTILDKAQSLINKRKTQIEALDELVKSRFIEMFGDPVVNTKGWEKNICYNITSKIGSGATPKGGNSSYKVQGISFIRSMNVHNNKFINKDLAFINKDQAGKLKNVVVEENDILLNITGASVARSCIVPSKILPARVNQHVSIIRVNSEKISPIFLVYQFTNDCYQRFLRNIATNGGATREAITKQQLEKLEVILPPIEFQNQFADFVKQVDKLKFEMEKSLQELEDNFNSLMQKSFKGELFN
ncbi:restriction endonuclease subunit S [Clostridium botulinum]|uniref:restriction endonuclease subunit S n=1 Tax=Clostridium botulinum TaxID=1491 RepID=UPI001C9B36D5|nr:restriction endonuclease subunit S [Clostridium botulinum]MBY6796869.1 restriction endonuclease subunit S [Clostridium botulinum]MBY6866707.1 restriction endonuclease subunit S [Clostridium botulinum]